MKTLEKDFTKGPITKKLLFLSIPIMGINILQILFNTVDLAVIGHYADSGISEIAVGAIGTTTPIINLIIGFFLGLSIGVNIVVSKCFGERDVRKSRRTVGTAVVISFVGGIIIGIIGFCLAGALLKLINCKGEQLELATKYLKIYFLGMPVIMLYNFSSAILRAVGDTIRPLIFLTIGGILNAILNIFFVVVFDWDVEGVAVATVISNGFSAICCLVVMLNSTGYAKLDWGYLKIFSDELKEILAVGIPSGISTICFSFSNVIIQASINSYGELVTSGNSVAVNLEEYVHHILQAIAISSASFVSQNYGAKDMKRVKGTFYSTFGLIAGIGIIITLIFQIFAKGLCHLITPSEDIVDKAIVRIRIVGLTYVLCGLQNATNYILRGIGKSVFSMITSIMSGCVFRVLLVLLVGYIMAGDIRWLYVTLPFTWGVTTILNVIVIFNVIKKYDYKITVKDS